MKFKLLIPLLLLPLISIAQRREEKKYLAELHDDITYLASDQLEGRRTGSKGEELAYQYIEKRFRAAGLQPKGENGFLQPFSFDEGLEIKPKTALQLNNKTIALQTGFVPLAFSANGKVSGDPLVSVQEPGNIWSININDVLAGASEEQRADINKTLLNKTNQAAKDGAKAVLFYNNKGGDLSFYEKYNGPTAAIPVIYLTNKAAADYLADETASLHIQLTVETAKKITTGHNVLAYLDNNAASTIIIGAHYDHLGYGQDGNSLYRGPQAVYNGADDNASGLSAMLCLAELLKDSRYKHHNYLFIAFSGEELGLLGSEYFTAHPTVDLSKIDYMINLDMVGRLNKDTHTLQIGGVGSSPDYGNIFEKANRHHAFSLQYDSSGMGPSDHAAFYQKNIPVLFFFTGVEEDYHKPTDDAEKINYDGEWMVINYIYNVIGDLDKTDKLAFSKTKTPPQMLADFKVTLGIMPDYAFSGQGLRINAVDEARPASKAGLKAGDVIIKLGDYPVNSIQDYMKALSQFNKGDTTNITVMRDQQEINDKIIF